jgi:hypothetical protein
MPLSMPDNAFTNLGSAFDAQQQQAGLSQLMSEEDFKRIQALNDPKTNLALMSEQAKLAGNTPTLKFGGNDFAEGLGNGINNYYAMKGYNQQNQAYKDIQNVYQQSQAKQRELVMGRIAADQARRQGAVSTIPEQLHGLYGTLNPAGQDSLLGSIGTSEIGLHYDPIKTTANAIAAEVGAEKVRTMRGQEFGNVDLNSGQLSPADRERYRQINGYYPEDAVNTRERQADLQSKEGAAYKAGVDTHTYATQQALELQAKDLSNKLSAIKLQAEPYEIESRLRDSYQNHLINGTKFNQAQQAIQMWDGLLNRMKNGDMPTQGEMALFSSGMKVLAGQVPELNKAFEASMNLKKGQKPKDEDWNKFFGGGGSSRSPATAIPSLSIQPKATQGNLVQSPNTGKWYNLDQRDANGYPTEVPMHAGNSGSQQKSNRKPVSKELQSKYPGTSIGPVKKQPNPFWKLGDMLNDAVHNGGAILQ